MVDVRNRKVVQIEPKQAVAGGLAARLLDFLDRDLIILWGDPGAGETKCFEIMAGAEAATLDSVRRFVARNGDVQAQTVYLDGLDQYRPRASAADINAAIPLLQMLRKSGAPRLRLSCRFADWLGNADLELFKDYARDYVVLALQPLDQQDAIEILKAHNIAQPEMFLAEAKSRNMGWIVSNAQMLLMLAEVVGHSGWPKTKRELYEQWSIRHLAEQKSNLQQSSLGRYAPELLLDPAGAACASILISDVIGVRRSSALDEQVPSYQSVPFSSHEMVLAALSRSAFLSVDHDIATTAHRTIAEYLGARWLGKKVNEGLPVSRIQALLGVDAHPSPSLRGLHAWLPLFLPLQAPTVIPNDPIGVLGYGDAASLSPSQKAELIKAVAEAVAENAWFMNQGLSDYGLKGLSCPETANQLLTILNSAVGPGPLKTFAPRAISAGQPLAYYRPALELLLSDPGALPIHRKLAFESLLRYGTEGVTAITQFYLSFIVSEPGSIGLKASIVRPPVRPCRCNQDFRRCHAFRFWADRGVVAAGQ